MTSDIIDTHLPGSVILPLHESGRITLHAFTQLAGSLGGYPYVKIVLDLNTQHLHFIDSHRYSFHADYIGERIKGLKPGQINDDIDGFNKLVYLTDPRPYCLGIIALHSKDKDPFFTLETVEIDNMSGALLSTFFSAAKQTLDPQVPLYFKPANHLQEATVSSIDPVILPRLFNHELFATKDYVCLNVGEAEGRLRIFSDDTYRQDGHTIKWYDILCMERVPDDIPRVSGLINSAHTTPLSHTNVLACGWGIPNCVQLGVIDQIRREGLDGQWVKFKTSPDMSAIDLRRMVAPASPPDKPLWRVNRVRLEEPETGTTPILPLSALRMTDRYRYGTKAANLGELRHILDHGSNRLIGYYRIPRPPRENLLPYLATAIGAQPTANLAEKAYQYLKNAVQIPRGIALPFSLQQECLQGSWKIQQTIGKLKMALELNAKESDALCLELQRLIRATRLSDRMRDLIDGEIATHLAGVRQFVIRSSSNAEDLKDFSAAGIYESINHVTTADNIFESIKEVWASLVSPRSIRLRQEVGISLDDCYMGVIIQEEVSSDMGGVMVTLNPASPEHDFRNVYINVSDKSAVEVVTGKVLPNQYLYNTVEGGGRTIAIGAGGKELSGSKQDLLQKLAFAGRLLQSHFAQDYSFSTPADIEWAANGNQLYILQLRPYAH